MRLKEYTAEEMKALLEHLSGLYDLARVVDPIECRVLEFSDGGKVTVNQSCYGIWNAEQKCVNCSSAAAFRTGCRQEKEERFRDRIFHIQSSPVMLKLPEGGTCSAVIELVSITPNGEAGPANDREAENDDHRAAQFEAVHDNLTRVLNPGAFYEMSRELIVRAPAGGWVMITANIMNFRLINALFGVLKGNEVLLKTGGLLRQIAEEAGGLCGRLGGDQFALLVPQQAFREEALLQAGQALAGLFDSGVYTLRIHFGVYRIEDPGLPVSVMCGRANSALRTIRESLKATVAYFDDALKRKDLFEQEVISGFKTALREKQFQMYLQPLAGADGVIRGAEALVRWRRPDGSVVQPGEFIETLEQAGLIHELDVYIWEEAVRQLSLWKDTDKKDLTISVNMSAKDFFNIDVFREISGLVEKYGVDSGKLRLEITETALLEDMETTNRVVARLQQAGFLVEIDDFGKGNSSLSLLKEIHSDVLKIDMSLLREIEKKQRSRIILASVINMANSLGMDVITEGVETRDQIDALAAMGCHHYQGYYFSRPVPDDMFEQLFRPGGPGNAPGSAPAPGPERPEA